MNSRYFKSVIALVLSMMIFTDVPSQTAKTIDSLENEEQSCLDKGAYMLGCEKRFYYQMDSMLNVAYFKLRSGLDSAQRAALKKEQLKWLATRDSSFKSTYNEFKKNNPDISPYGSAFGAQDDAMFMYRDNAVYVKERVLTLLRRLQSK